ncbi:hypothetical protein BpHYR1_050345 [Brachionus plicatilis]|uniref:Uncharacterized protein n=1 Tax=Brachionus plicatilis TaxID=10195 RepID=A0A3M7T1Z2_BRAPC|nr:hypothetical protein BpHYR1_050345 [Brachionus plicatilis]
MILFYFLSQKKNNSNLIIRLFLCDNADSKTSSITASLATSFNKEFNPDLNETNIFLVFGFILNALFP